jgi:Lrp/AsnC family leucine-responsive transcriptional regulator
MEKHPDDLDRIDRKILAILQEDGRISNLKLAESVALSPTAVLARVQRLTREDYIVGYEARLNPLKLGAVLWQLPGVRETRTYAVMEEVKHSTRLPL